MQSILKQHRSSVWAPVSLLNANAHGYPEVPCNHVYSRIANTCRCQPLLQPQNPQALDVLNKMTSHALWHSRRMLLTLCVLDDGRKLASAEVPA